MLQKYIFYFRKQRFFLQISQKTCDLEEKHIDYRIPYFIILPLIYDK